MLTYGVPGVGDILFWSVLTVVAAAVVALLWYWRGRNPRGTVLAGVVWRVVRLYCRVVHRLRVEGAEHVPSSRTAGPLVVVSNHTAGVDPVLIQASCPFEVRWMMASDMRVRALEPLWRWLRIIDVKRSGPGAASMREALAHLERGGVVGVFPEGGIERPARTLRRFLPGAGLLIARSGAPVLPVVVDGTPYTKAAWGSLLRPSRARVRFLPRITYPDGTEAKAVTSDLERRFAEATGWARRDERG